MHVSAATAAAAEAGDVSDIRAPVRIVVGTMSALCGGGGGGVGDGPTALSPAWAVGCICRNGDRRLGCAGALWVVSFGDLLCTVAASLYFTRLCARLSSFELGCACDRADCRKMQAGLTVLADSLPLSSSAPQIR